MLSADRGVAGTWSYIAPEMITSAVRADGRSDIYSLGVTLYELLCGQLPLDGASPAALARMHLTAKPACIRKLVPDLAKPIASLVHRMLAKQPLRRPQSAAELIRELVHLEIRCFADRLPERLAG